MRTPFLSFDKQRNVWCIYYYDTENKRQRQSTGVSTRRAANAALLEFKVPEALPSTIVTLSQYQHIFLEYAFHKYTLETYRAFYTTMRSFISVNGDARLIDVGIKDVQLYLAKIESGVSRWSAFKYYGAMASMFERAKEWGYVKQNIWREVKKPRQGERRIIFFEKDQFNRFVESVEKKHRNIYTFGVHTGMRLGELCNAQWSHVDWEKNHIEIVSDVNFQTKSKRSRRIPMSKTLRALLTSMPRRNEFIFAGRVKGGMHREGTSNRFKYYVQQNLWLDQRMHFHSLRHTFASWLVQGHVPLMEVQKLLGHSSISTTEIYAHLLDDTLHDAVSVLD
jgi:integrase